MRENYVYPVKTKETDDGIEIEFLDFPNLVTYAENREEIIPMAQEALAVTILDLENRNKELPKPTMTDGNALFVHIWMPYFRNITKEIYIKKSVTIPQWLDILAKNNSVNFSAALVKGLKLELGIEN